MQKKIVGPALSLFFIKKLEVSATHGPLIWRSMRLALLGGSLWMIFQFIGTPQAALGQEGGTSLEYLVKGAYLYNFMKFIDWPPQDFSSSDSPYVLCMLGKDPFDPVFEKQLQEKTVRNRKLLIRHTGNPDEARSCHILFISGVSKAVLREAIEGLKGKSVLLVGDSEDFSRMGGMIQFILEGGRVRFEINLLSAERSGLKISSKLLQVAKAGGQR